MNRRSIFGLSALAALGLAVLPGSAVAQTAKDLVGTWQLVSAVNTAADGAKTDTFGPHGTGTMIFASDGHFAQVQINPDVAKFTANNRAQGTADENKTVVAGSLGFFGTYSVADKVIDEKVEGSTYPNWTGMAFPPRGGRWRAERDG